MLPGMYEFHWDLGHVIFLGAFFSVVLTLITVLMIVARRARQDLVANRQDSIRWREDFEALPASRRRCRHEITGRIEQRCCENGFECGCCPHHVQMIGSSDRGERTASKEEVYGLHLPLDRLYHRGHTWLRMLDDGTMEIGLDDLGRRLFGSPDVIALPTPGQRIHANGQAWEMKRNGNFVRVLAPVDGTVVETGDLERGWLLRVRPDRDRRITAHLLRGREIRPWIEQEVDLLLNRLASRSLGPTLADGGQLVEDLPRAYPRKNWESVWNDFFLGC